MKILGLDSSGLVASVAIVENENLLGEYTVNYKKTHSQTLLPMLDEVARMIELDLETIDAIAIAGGPGSFTGLRIGSATAKGLGLALNKPIINVPTVDALAYNLAGHQSLVCPLMDARRNQTYTGLYRFHTNEMETLREQCAVGIDEIVAYINETGQPVVFLGDGIPVFSAYIQENVKVPWSFAPAHMNKQRAGAVAALGMKYFAAGRYESAAEHRPEYLRLSQAERERKEQQHTSEPENAKENPLTGTSETVNEGSRL
ncbi:MAG: tRNA (adenosine(37)-N6)-threonylcarbamoyltransferase complex dimerization subunit type 1 TsaB [Roseburia sp.]|nr:tRNA (adenosine(37)-N6)-threonylcarbamoyltransferase complex dimerization subunit type 1 TsaB [Roseburia sp.]